MCDPLKRGIHGCSIAWWAFGLIYVFLRRVTCHTSHRVLLFTTMSLSKPASKVSIPSADVAPLTLNLSGPDWNFCLFFTVWISHNSLTWYFYSSGHPRESFRCIFEHVYPTHSWPNKLWGRSPSSIYIPHWLWRFIRQMLKTSKNMRMNLFTCSLSLSNDQFF